MEKILIIEDDTDINNLIAEALGKAGYDCVQAFSGTEGLLYAKTDRISLAVMDLMLPGMTGEQLLPKLHEQFGLPVIVLSAKDSLDSKISLLNMGAEDYMTKPFELDELIARVGVQIRRYSSQPDASSKAFTHNGLTLDPENYLADFEGQRLSFTKQEFKILELLMSHPNRVFSKQDIYDYAWDDIYIGEDKTINMHISNIRKKLKAVTDREFIETVWGIGFKLAIDS
ncbi:MAG: response regulator transcription factor [Oscillospiraceae bacterium]